MSFKIEREDDTTRSLLNILNSIKSMAFQAAEDFIKVGISEDLTVSGATGAIRAYKTDDVVKVVGVYVGWSSGAIATLSTDYRPTATVVFGDVSIATSGAITPTTAASNFSGEFLQ